MSIQSSGTPEFNARDTRVHDTSDLHTAESSIDGSFLEGCPPRLFGRWLVLQGMIKIEPRQRGQFTQQA